MRLIPHQEEIKATDESPGRHVTWTKKGDEKELRRSGRRKGGKDDAVKAVDGKVARQAMIEQAWPAWYDRLVATFGYNPAEDQRAADVLSRLLQGRAISLSQLRNAIRSHPVLVLGAGPSVDDDLKGLLEAGVFGDLTLLAADGATTAALHVAKSVPRIVVTDLDGRVPDLLQADRAGSLMVIHGHGDNIPMLERLVPRIENPMGTTQVQPRPNVYNFGGFTDGDRAVFLATAMEARLVVLAGMDFGPEVGRYSKAKPRSIHVKRKKLMMGRALLEWLASRTQVPLYDVTGRGEGIRGFQKTSAREVRSLL